jgi:ankyrin repeat protein
LNFSLSALYELRSSQIFIAVNRRVKKGESIMRTIGKAFTLLLLAIFPLTLAVAGPIHDAAKNGDTAQVKALLGAGTQVDEKDALDKTVLNWASENSHTEVVQILAANGADVNTGDFMGQTALSWATTLGNDEIVEILITAGADVNQQDSMGTRPLDHSVRKGHKRVDEMLRDAGAECGTNYNYSQACNQGFGQSKRIRRGRHPRCANHARGR